MVSLGAVAVLILASGFFFFLRFAPPGQGTGLRARVEGVYAYDPSTKSIKGHPSRSFTPDQQFAARVDWASLPATVTVGAHWYNSLEEEVGGVGPSPAGS